MICCFAADLLFVFAFAVFSVMCCFAYDLLLYVRSAVSLLAVTELNCMFSFIYIAHNFFFLKSELAYSSSKFMCCKNESPSPLYIYSRGEINLELCAF